MYISYVPNNISISITDSRFSDMPTMKVQIIPLKDIYAYGG